MASLAQGVYGGVAAVPKIVLSVPPRDVLRKTLMLPAAVEPNLRQALAYDLDRHTPFKAEELYFDAVVVGRNPAKKEIRVDLVACRKAVVDAAMRHATAWGADVVAAVPGASGGGASFAPQSVAARGAVVARHVEALAILAAAGAGGASVALAAIAIPLWQKRDYAIALNTLAAEARAQAAVSDGLRAELETKVGDYNFALERKYAYPSAFRVVDEVSRVLPDDTWLTQFEMKSIAKGKETQREILVRGETANAGRLVQLFEESPLFAQTAPRSPTTKIQPGPGEIFDLGAQVKPLAVPAQVALLAKDKAAETGCRERPRRRRRQCSPRPPRRGPTPRRRRTPAAPAGAPTPGDSAGDCERALRRAAPVPRRRSAREAGQLLPPRRPAGAVPIACDRNPAATVGPRAAARHRRLRWTPAKPKPARLRPPWRRIARQRREANHDAGVHVAALAARSSARLRWACCCVAVVWRLSCCWVRSCSSTGTMTCDRGNVGPARLYRRVAAQAPDLRAALDVMKQKDGRRFFLRNTAPNLAGAELSDLVRAAIENNSGRITTSQSPAPRDDGRFRQTSSRCSSSRPRRRWPRFSPRSIRRCPTSWSTT